MVRIKHRYLLVDILFPESSNSKEFPASIAINKPCPKWFDAGCLIRLIRFHVSENFGDYGAGVLGGSLSIKYLSQATSTAIIRCPRAHHRLVWAALTFAGFLSRYGGGRKHDEKVECIFRVVRVSGTIKKAEEAAIRRARKQILAATSEDGGTFDAMFLDNEVEGASDDEDVVDDTMIPDYDEDESG